MSLPQESKPLWYVVHTYTGYENKVLQSLEKIIENRGIGDLIQAVKIPTEIVVEMTDKGEKEIERKLFPSYVFVKMVMNDEMWHIIRNTTGVTGFVGPGSRPDPFPMRKWSSWVWNPESSRYVMPWATACASAQVPFPALSVSWMRSRRI